MPELPIQFLNSLKDIPSFDETDFVNAHREDKAIVSVRLNPFKLVTPDFELSNKVKWCNDAYYLNERPSFTRDPLFQAGAYYVQEAGSMFLHHVLKHTLNFNETLKVLDSCAAPGGKSTLINSLLNEESILVSNELIKSRADILVHNLSKWGTINTVVTNGETSRFTELTEYFDAMVIDAPCSGSGLFRKQPESILEWSVSHVKSCSIRQIKILNDLIPALKKDGILVYSTCSYSYEENEQVVQTIMQEYDMELVEIPINDSWGIVKSDLGYRFYPHLTQSEGFYCAVLRKIKSTGNFDFKPKKKKNVVGSNELKFLREFIDPVNHHLLEINGRFNLMNEEVSQFIFRFEKSFYFKKAGLKIGEIKGRNLVPDQELAWYYKDLTTFNTIELTKEDALIFLRKENLSLKNYQAGFSLLTYKGLGLGWAKILPNRVNNYFPNELRILK